MRYSSDLTWEGWIYWSFILLFQRKEDGPVMENGWINGPVYAVEINVDPDTCETPQLIVARMDFDGIRLVEGLFPSEPYAVLQCDS